MSTFEYIFVKKKNCTQLHKIIPLEKIRVDYAVISIMQPMFEN